MNPWTSFWHGLVRPSLAALVIVFVIVAALWIACFLTITPGLMATDAHLYFAASPIDHYLFLTGRVMKLSQMELTRPAVLITGASGMGEALPVPEVMAEYVTRHTSFDIFLTKLISHGQSILEAIAITEMLPERFQGVLVLGINPRRLGTGLAKRSSDGVPRYRLGFTSEAHEAFALEGGVDRSSTGNYLWDNRRFFLPRVGPLLESLWKGPLYWSRERARADHPNVHEYTERGMVPEKRSRRVSSEKWLEEKIITLRELKGYEVNAPQCLRALAEMAARLQRKYDVRVILLEGPVSPLGIDSVLGQEFYIDHVARLREFAANSPLEYWNLNQEAKLVNEDFYDMIHLGTQEAQERYSSLLAEKLAEVLVEMQSGSP